MFCCFPVVEVCKGHDAAACIATKYRCSLADNLPGMATGAEDAGIQGAGAHSQDKG